MSRSWLCYGQQHASAVCLVCVVINHLCACAARVTVLGLSVCLSVDAYSGTTGYEAAYELCKQVQIYEGLNNKKAILLKRLRSGDTA